MIKFGLRVLAIAAAIIFWPITLVLLFLGLITVPLWVPAKIGVALGKVARRQRLQDQAVLDAELRDRQLHALRQSQGPLPGQGPLPLFCQKCGAGRGEADKFCRGCGASLAHNPVQQPKVQQSRRRLSPVVRALLWIGAVLLGLSLLHAIFSAPEGSGPEPGTEQATSVPKQDTADQSASDQGQAQQAGGQPQPAGTDQIISVDAQALLAEFQSDEKAAATKFDNRKVSVTGALTGVFVPPPGVILKMAEEGRAADAFVTMAGPLESSPEEALLSPGITAYSESGSLFGGDVVADLTVGESVTLICTVENGSEALSEGTGYSLMLDDCTLAQAEAPEAEPREMGGTDPAGPTPGRRVGQSSEIESQPRGASQEAAQPLTSGQPNLEGYASPSQSAGQAVPSSIPAATSEAQTSMAPGAPQAEPTEKSTEATPQVSQPATAEIAAGTTVEVLTSDPIASDVNRTGDILRASLAAPIVVGGQIVVPKSASIFLRALQVLPPHRCSAQSKLPVHSEAAQINRMQEVEFRVLSVMRCQVRGSGQILWGLRSNAIVWGHAAGAEAQAALALAPVVLGHCNGCGVACGVRSRRPAILPAAERNRACPGPLHGLRFGWSKRASVGTDRPGQDVTDRRKSRPKTRVLLGRRSGCPGSARLVLFWNIQLKRE
jgi:hypothetical protein